jgi:hypothetical protein
VLSEFFEPPPPRPSEREPEQRQPPWFGPPHGVLPGVVPVELVLAQNEEAAVCVSRLAAYPTGFEFDLITMVAPGQDELDLDPLMFRHRRLAHRRREQEEIPAELLRIGVQFSDGSKATNTGGYGYDQDPPPGPVMHEHGGGGGGRSWRQTYWIWPLPTPGPVSLVCEWPAAGIALTRVEIDAQTILDAADRAQVLFPDHPAQGSPASWTSYGSASLAGTIKPKPEPNVE